MAHGRCPPFTRPTGNNYPINFQNKKAASKEGGFFRSISGPRIAAPEAGDGSINRFAGFAFAVLLGQKFLHFLQRIGRSVERPCDLMTGRAGRSAGQTHTRHTAHIHDIDMLEFRFTVVALQGRRKLCTRCGNRLCFSLFKRALVFGLSHSVVSFPKLVLKKKARCPQMRQPCADDQRYFLCI